uniref:Uncharacterized protein n=1 Tax=Chelonoidis abingdonii TaxID=106734 RepID=A0A8C0H5V0_CHEAB
FLENSMAMGGASSPHGHLNLFGNPAHSTCSICLEYLTEPVMIACGHNFCRACITQYTEQRKPQSGTKFPCPECRVLFQKGNFRPNRQLGILHFPYGDPLLKSLLWMRDPHMDVTLDPDTAHPNLVLSQDRKRVRRKTKRQNLPNNPERFDPCVFVLGAEGFTGGRHYWEVEMADKTRWILGVCKESVSRKNPDHLSPKNGYWTVCLRDGEYKALTDPWTPLPVSVRPSRVGIFLDYKAGEVSFYNVSDRSHLFTFTDTFSGTVRPFFSPCANAGGKNTAPLIICSVPAQARGNLGP